ncbi:MAG: hypothetical protein IKH75_02180 [Ruminococcus sp.]|nr:hypothetical protein [Ruminococcus sp.]
MKWLSNYFGNGINMDNIISVVWIPFSEDDNDEKLKGKIINSDTQGVVYATDVNNNIIVLGEYTDQNKAQNAVQWILDWLSNLDDDEYFLMPTDDNEELAKEFSNYKNTNGRNEL